MTAPGGAGHGHPADFNPHHHAGGDDAFPMVPRPRRDFNPHHHAGGDTYIQRMDGGTAISIHTTTQGVTNTDAGKDVRCLNFNPHHHAGGDHGGCKAS